MLSGEMSALPLSHDPGCPPGDCEHPITLAEALRRWPDVRFNIDVKDDDTVQAFLRAMSEAQAWDRVCVAAFSTVGLRRLRALAGPRLATSMGPPEVTRLVLGVPDRSPACAAQVPHRWATAGRHPGFVRSVRTDGGWQVHVWTIDDPPEMAALLDMGVDGIMTDRPSPASRRPPLVALALAQSLHRAAPPRDRATADWPREARGSARVPLLSMHLPAISRVWPA